MKALFIFSLCIAIMIGATAQIPDTLLTIQDYKTPSPSGRSYAYEWLSDTITVASPDTFHIILPHIFAEQLVGHAQMAIDTIPDIGAILAGSFKVFTAQCLTCPTKEIGSSVFPENVGVASAVTEAIATVDDLRAWVEVYVDEGDGLISFWITLKPD